MLETPHVALGAAIAVAIPNPLISIPLAFMSHFVLDMTPHWNPHLNTELKQHGRLTNKTLTIIAFDLALALVLTGFLSYRVSSDSSMFTNILLCSFFAVLPDIIEAPYFLLGWKNKFLIFWLKLQKSIQADANLFWGLLTQIIVLVACLYSIIY